MIKASINRSIEKILLDIKEIGKDSMSITKNVTIKIFSLFIYIDRFLFYKCNVYSHGNN